MAGILSVTSRALMANQAVLSTIGHNIANVNTPGYSRQVTTLQDVAGQFSGGGYIGKGVEVTGIDRIHSDFLTRQAAVSKSAAAADSVRLTQLNQLQDVFQGGASGLGSAVNDFMNSLSDVASAPTDLVARSVALTRADEAAGRFRSAALRLDDLKTNVLGSLQDKIVIVNDLAARIAKSNDLIANAQGSGATPNDLLDQREQLISQINQYIQTSSVDAGDGTVTLFVASSQALVMGTEVSPLKLSNGSYGAPSQLALSITRGGVSVPMDDASLGGGELAGLLNFHNKDLAEGGNLLGRYALSMVDAVNAQHRVGLDLDGNPGQNLFVLPSLPASTPPAALRLNDAFSSTTNTGSGVVRVDVSDASRFSPANYEIRATASGVDVVRLTDNQITTSATGLPVTVDGLTFSLDSGAPAVGDKFLVEPFSAVAANVQTAFSSPRNLAVANPIQAAAGSTNVGTLNVASLKAQTSFVMPVPPATITPTTLTFTASTAGPPPTPATYDDGVNPPAAYSPGQPIQLNGWEITFTGVPQTGDTYTLSSTSAVFVPRNSGNASALMALRDKPLYDGASLTDGYAGLMGQLGVRTQSAKFAAEVSDSIATTVEKDRAGVAGVNLDEEAGKMLQYQQAYQAAGKALQIANNMFDTLMQSITR